MHAADARMAIENARELYTRRSEGVSLWVVPSALITASSPDEKEPLFDPAQDKVYRHASFYELPAEVGHM
ncbi:1,2-phenylacetyl-CoA epoxidase, subunit B [compost metagenome]